MRLAILMEMFMKLIKKVISVILTSLLALSLLCSIALAAGSFAEGYTLDDALSKLGVAFSGDMLDWLTISGEVKTQAYTYFPYQNARTGTVEEHPVYCIDPSRGGVREGIQWLGVSGNYVTYYRGEKVGNPYYLAIMGAGYPHITLTSLGLDSSEQGYYATKMALWLYILGVDETKLGINPKYGSGNAVAQKVFDAAVAIYKNGMYGGSRGYEEPSFTITVDRTRPYLDTSGQYRQQILTIESNRWIGDTPLIPGDYMLSWANPSAVPAGTRIELPDGTDITSTMKVQADLGKNATIVVKYPVAADEFSVQLNVKALLTGNDIYTAYYSGDEGDANLQRYLVEADPKKEIVRTFAASFIVEDDDGGGDGGGGGGDMGLRIRKVEAGSNKPLGGGVYEVRDPNGVVINIISLPSSGEMFLPLGVVGYYTVTEIVPPQNYILPQNPTQGVLVEYGKTATVTFSNSPYGTLMVYKKDLADGRNLEGAVIQIKNITTGVTQTATTDSSGSVTFDKLPCAVDGTGYEVREIAAPSGYVLDLGVHTVSVRPLSEGVTSYTLTNEANPGLRIRKFDQQTMVAIAGITFEIWRDGLLLGEYVTDLSGEIFLPSIQAGTFTVKEKSTVEPYLLDPTPQTIEIKPGDGIKELVFHNLRKPTMIIRKYDQLTAQLLPNTEFSVKTKGGVIIWEGMTDADGTIILPNMDIGWITITELAPAPGYLPATGPKDVLLEPGKTVEVKFDNLPCPTLTISKTDSITGDPIGGVKFNVKFSPAVNFTGGVVDLGTFITDVNGRILLNDNLQSGWYRVTELEPKSGYAFKEPTTQDIFLAGGDNKTLHFENIPLSALIIRKIDNATGTPVAGASFRIRYLGGTSGSGGTIIHEGVTSHNGTIVLTGLIAGTYVVEEYRAAPGYELSNPSVQTAYLSGNDQDVVTLEFANAHKGNLIITKLDNVTGRPLAGATLKVTDSSGAVIGPNNGIYTTDASGVINLAENLSVGSTIIVTETRAPSGYILDGTPQTIKIQENTTHALTFYNTPIGGVQIIKLDADTRIPISGVQFTISKMNGERIGGIYITNSTGQIYLPMLDNGWYTAVEIKAPSQYLLDSTPHNFEVKDGRISTLTITNKKASGILIQKVDSITGKGIYGVQFLLSDAGNNPVGMYTSDQDGFVYIGYDEQIPYGKYFLREIRAADGYVKDDEIKTVYLEAGKTSQITWKNTAITAQIQVIKYSQDFNPITGAPAGVLLKGAVFEITQARSGAVVGYITSDERGVAASPPLPLGRYFVKEVTPAPYTQLNTERFEADLEYAGQIVRIAVYNKSATLGTEIHKTGNIQVIAGDSMRYDLSIKNTSNVPLTDFYWSDRLPTDATRIQTLTTGTYNQRLYYRVVYKTNTGNWRTLASNLLTTNNYSFSLHTNALGLASGEVVTDVKLEFGTVPAGFASVTKPTITVQTLSTLAKGYIITNRAYVGGKYHDAPQESSTVWITEVIRFDKSEQNLPKTGY